MKLNIKCTNFEFTPIISQYIEGKLGLLDKLIEKFDIEGGVRSDVEVGRTTQHHLKGPVYRAEINLHLPGKMLRAEHEDFDLRIAIDRAKGKLQREIVKYKELSN